MEILASRFLLHPRDLERSLGFYRDTLGLHPMREFGTAAGPGVVFFLGAGLLEITAGGEGRRGVGSGTELWLQVRDVRAVESALADAGVPILESAERKPWGLVELRAEDPDGLVLIFVEVPPDHPLRRDTRSARD